MNSVCKFFAQNRCHTTDCSYEHVRFDKEIVCKHWFSGKCKLDEKCSRLHEYDMSRMEVCQFFSRDKECSAGFDCDFLHVTEDDRKQDCPWYDRGFCKHGAQCRNRHNRKDACSNYLTGFCPLGPKCPLGQLRIGFSHHLISF
jgi:cleavage and polyadenylation specificity factor subunit 4